MTDPCTSHPERPASLPSADPARVAARFVEIAGRFEGDAIHALLARLAAAERAHADPAIGPAVRDAAAAEAVAALRAFQADVRELLHHARGADPTLRAVELERAAGHAPAAPSAPASAPEAHGPEAHGPATTRGRDASATRPDDAPDPS